MKESLSVAEARRIALAAQGFAQPRPTVAGTRQLNLAMARMSTLQIDSVNVFARSHYMPLFSRLGPYDPAALDRLLFARPRAVRRVLGAYRVVYPRGGLGAVPLPHG